MHLAEAGDSGNWILTQSEMSVIFTGIRPQLRLGQVELVMLGEVVCILSGAMARAFLKQWDEQC